MRTLLSLTLLVIPVLACSSKSSSSSATDAGSTSTTFSCGKGTFKGTIQFQDPTNLGPVAGATLAADGCSTVTTDDRGFVDAATDAGFLIKVSLTKDGYFNEYGETTVLQDNFQASSFQFPLSTKSTIFTGWQDTQGYLVVVVNGDRSDGGACASAQGATVSIKDHPEIPTGYMKDNSTRDATMKAVGSIGFAVLGPIPPGSYEVDATKTGCTSVGFKGPYFQFSSTVTIKANTVTGGNIMLQPQ